jgi:ATP-dependent exoDNAse (exonuclease V) beta subunit
MAPNQAEYGQFLQAAIEQLTVSTVILANAIATATAELMYSLCLQRAPCKNKFQAILNAMLASKACDRTGVVAIACAQHGCYAPNALVDLFRGEQQKNVDFVFLQALKTTRVDLQQGVMLIYNIVC